MATTGLVESFKGLITSEHRGKPKFMATLETLLNYSEGIYATAVYMDEEFDLDLAAGAQEDVLGILVGASRELGFQPHTQDTAILNDEDYRFLLKAKLAKNLWRGGIADLQEIWYSIFGEDIIIKDFQDMSIEVEITNVPSNVVHEMILQGYIVPKPQSVRMNYHVIRKLDSKYWIGGGGSQYTRAQVRQPYADGGTVTVTVYCGAVGSQHTRAQIRQPYADGDTATTTAYIGGGGSQYTRAQINPTDLKVAHSTRYYGSHTSRHMRTEMEQTNLSVAKGTHYYGGTTTRHMRTEMEQTNLSVAKGTHYYGGTTTRHMRTEMVT